MAYSGIGGVTIASTQGAPSWVNGKNRSSMTLTLMLALLVAYSGIGGVTIASTQGAPSWVNGKNHSSMTYSDVGTFSGI